MKIAITKIGANITFSSGNKSAANADIMYFIRQLNHDDHEITFHTGLTRNTQVPRRVGQVESIQNTKDFDEYDRVLVFNGAINFFGGAIDNNLLALYEALRRTTKTPIVYVHTDGQMPFRQLWNNIWKREWAQNLKAESFDLSGENVFYLTQGYNEPKMDKMLASKPDNIMPARVIFYPLAQTIMANHEKFIKPNPIPYAERTYDLMFGGATRNTYKKKKIEKFYSRSNLDVCLFGNLRGVHVPDAFFRGKVSYQQVIHMYWQSKATIIIGDQFYNDNFVSLRYYESLLADNVIYIDSEMDPNRRMVGIHIDHNRFIRTDPEIYLEWTEIRKEQLAEYDYDEERERLVSCLESCTW